jgi:hypothetical protein
MRSDRTLSVMGCLALLLSACLDPIAANTLTPPRPPGSTDFSGTVTDSCTGEPLAGVQVSVCPDGTICTFETAFFIGTNRGGEFLFPDLAPGRWKVTAALKDYRISEWTLALSGGPHAPVVLPLPRIRTPPPTATLDVLFVIDNSTAMEQEQASLAKAFYRFFRTLTDYPIGVDRPLGLDLHIGVVSTDMGAGGAASCEKQEGDGGKLLTRAGCTRPSGGDAFISATTSVGSSLVASNLSGDTVEHAFECIAQLGTGGCGFEQPLASLVRAVDGVTNPGFLRPGAALAVIVLSDEDDCSAKNPALYDLAHPELGPLTSYRCFQLGITCSSNDGAGVKQDCKPGGQYLLDVKTVADTLKLRREPQTLYFAVIAGPREPVEVTVEGSSLALRPSCQYIGGVATPAVRLSAVADLLWPYSSFESICASDLGDTLSGIASRIVTTTLLNPCN